MSTQKYIHEHTGKVGSFRDDFAALFPELRPVEVTPEPIDAPVDEAPARVDVKKATPSGKHAASTQNRKVAE